MLDSIGWHHLLYMPLKPNQNSMNLKKYFGPSTLIAAAFIGPGTITTCTIAGVKSGYTLIWAMVFSTIATMILQEMAARLGFTTQKGLGEAINSKFDSGVKRYLIFALVISAILVGNAAYEAGNLSGGILGMDLIFGEFKYWVLLLGSISFVLLYIGKYKWIEKILIALVIAMSLSFLLTTIIVKPDITDVLKGLVPSNFNKENLLLIMGLIGTTVVPYNLFLHASTISKKWTNTDSLRDIRIENNVSILFGGLISMMIIITAGTNNAALTDVTSAKDLALQLQPLVGDSAKTLMGIGLLAAGLSSALTAPLAAAYAAKGLFGWSEKSIQFKAVWMVILGIGVTFSLLGFKSIAIIKFAQVANALLLPLIAIFLIYLCNDKNLLGKNANTTTSNFLGGIIILITLMLSVRTFIII